jgi:hypothetical protein
MDSHSYITLMVDERMQLRLWWNDTDSSRTSSRRKICHSATLYATYAFEINWPVTKSGLYGRETAGAIAWLHLVSSRGL